MMAYWESVLPQGAILEVRYEDIINDLEGQSKKIAVFFSCKRTLLPPISRIPP